MKRVLFALSILMASFACKKDNLDPADVYIPDIPAVPARFSQNILIEQFTQSFNGQCPLGDLLLDTILSTNPDRIAAVNIHSLDQLASEDLLDTSNGLNLMDEYYNSTLLYPAGMINRNITGTSDLSIYNYATTVNSTLSRIPRCGLAIDANDLPNGYLNLSVHVGFSEDLLGSYRLHVYLVEKGFQSNDSSYFQRNDFSQSGATPDSNLVFYNLPDPIFGYNFPYVLRNIITPVMEGEVIPAANAMKGKEYIRSYIIDLRNKTVSNYTIIAFVDKYGTTGTSHQVENSRMVQVGKVAAWN